MTGLRSDVGRKLVVCACLAVAGWAIYRSVTVSITVNEAIAFNHYASKGLKPILTLPYSPNNPILHTLSCFLVLRVFRATEWALRIPNFLGLLFYFWASARISRTACRSSAAATAATLVCVVNPFTVGWLPVATGVWVAAALFLIAAADLLAFLTEDHRDSASLSRASLLLGLSSGFEISFVISTLTLLFVFLHFEFWGRRRLGFWLVLDFLFLPAFVAAFTLWCVPLLNRQTPVRFALLCVVLLPALIVLTLPSIARAKAAWQFTGGTLVVLATAISVLSMFHWSNVPDLFHQGSERAMAKTARALRDDLRHFGNTRPIHVFASQPLIESMNFYRRRYALGAVRPVVANETDEFSADYSILLPQDLARFQPIGKTPIFVSGSTALFARRL